LLVSANPFWKFIWKLRVPCAVQLFLWWGCNNILPTKDKLFHRKVVPDPFCPLCGVEVETAGHFLWRCGWLTGVWTECTRSTQKSVISDSDFLTIFHHFSTRLEIEVLELMAVTAHKLWTRRNRVVFGGKFLPPRCLVDCAKETLCDFQQARSSLKPVLGGGTRVQQRWVNPPDGWIKLN
jgi:hypothetical protein